MIQGIPLAQQIPTKLNSFWNQKVENLNLCFTALRKVHIDYTLILHIFLMMIVLLQIQEIPWDEIQYAHCTEWDYGKQTKKQKQKQNKKKN